MLCRAYAPLVCIYASRLFYISGFIILFMINTESKVIDIRSEMLFRSAEDDFFYLNKIDSAYKKLKKAVLLTPEHLKSLKLLADAAFIKGYTKKALEFYLKAYRLSGSDSAAAGAANCLYRLKHYTEALLYCDKAASSKHQNHDLMLQVFEIKIGCLAALKRYKSAYKAFKEAQLMFDKSELNVFKSLNYEYLSGKINLMQRIQHSNLKIV